MAPTIQVEPRQYNNTPGSGLVFQPDALSPTPLNRQQKLLPTVSGSERSVIIHRLTKAEFDRSLVQEHL